MIAAMYNKHKEKLIALAIFALVSIIFLSPFLNNITYLGVHDWDQHFFYSESARKTILEFHQIPLWNPYYCGGNVLLAHPESMFLSPMFLLNLIFGSVIGLKLQALFYMILGLFGMYLISRYLKLSRYSSFVPPFVYMLSSWYALHIKAGHTLYYTFALLPFAFYFFLLSLKNIKYVFISSIFLVLIAFGGGATYPFLFSFMVLGFYALIHTIKIKKFRPLLSLLLIVLVTFCLGAMKFIPMQSFLDSTSIAFDDKQPTSASILISSLLSRNQDIDSREFYSDYTGKRLFYDKGNLVEANFNVNTLWLWHEYSAYIGIFVFILFLFSFLFYKRYLELLLSSVFFLCLALGDNFFIYPLLRNLPIFSSLHGPSRFIIPAIFFISILAGISLSYLEKKNKNYGLIILMIILFDLSIIGVPLLKDTFTIEPYDLEIADEYFQVSDDEQYVSQFPHALQGIGSLYCYERLRPPLAASPLLYLGEYYSGYVGEAYLFRQNISEDISFWSPNKIIVGVDTVTDDVLLLNQNYINGWKVDGNDAQMGKGLVATRVDADTKEVTFRYLPKSFIVGFVLSLISLVGFSFLFFKTDH